MDDEEVLDAVEDLEEGEEEDFEYDDEEEDYDGELGSSYDDDDDELLEFEGFEGLTESVEIGNVGVEEKSFLSLGPNDIVSLQQEAIDRVSSVTNLPSASCRALLREEGWDAHRLLDTWSANPAAVCEAAGVVVGETQPSVPDDDAECEICMEPLTSDSTALPCSHWFCDDCWFRYLQIEVQEKRRRVSCCGQAGDGTKCTVVVDELTVLRLLAADADLQARYRSMMIESFVHDTPSVVWCPAANCDRAVMLKEFSNDRNEAVKCTCGTRFCFRCSLEVHTPSTCEMAKEWKTKTSGKDDTMNDQLIASISRPCPNWWVRV
jgi:ariadne-1